jgi:hypothetical protein
MTVVWTDDLVEFIRKRAGEKASASMIAGELGAQGYAVSRSAVISACHRKNIQLCSGSNGRHISVTTKNSKKRRSRLERGPKLGPATDGSNTVQVSQKTPVMRFVETRSNNPVPMGELTSDDCRWPMGGFADRPPYLYCGDPVLEGCSYCARHFDISTRLSTRGPKETNHVTAERGSAAA